MLSSKKRIDLHAALLRWYRKEARNLPWRKDSDPYRILVSEVMLQQTQVSRVLEKYPGFLRKFPDLRSLSRSSRRKVLLGWQGMGYNNRAVRLHALARNLSTNNRSRIPADMVSLIRLPGIGRYTANAMLSFAFRQRVPVVDTNIRRVLSRLLGNTAGLIEEKSAWQTAETLLPKRNSHHWNQALMDLGATICTARAPRCRICPIGGFCISCGKIMKREPKLLKKEPGFKGTPNRIYRGRVVEFLRSAKANRVSMKQLATHLHPHILPRHSSWLSSLLASLQRDGLVTIDKEGHFAEQKVSLA